MFTDEESDGEEDLQTVVYFWQVKKDIPSKNTSCYCMCDGLVCTNTIPIVFVTIYSRYRMS